MHKCYAIGRTADNEELHCCLARHHRGEKHYDSDRDQEWSVDIYTDSWAMVDA